MLTLCGILILALLFIGDIVILIKGIEEWKKKIDEKISGPRRNVWLIAFYIVSILLVLLTLYSWGFKCY